MYRSRDFQYQEVIDFNHNNLIRLYIHEASVKAVCSSHSYLAMESLVAKWLEQVSQ